MNPSRIEPVAFRRSVVPQPSAPPRAPLAAWGVHYVASGGPIIVADKTGRTERCV
jgi:hypothetical protein